MSCFYFCFFLLIFVFKVLGSPEMNFVANGQTRIKSALANVQCKKQPNRRKLSDKNVTKGYRYEDGKVHNGSNYQDYCIFFISLYRASPFAVSRYFCLG